MNVSSFKMPVWIKPASIGAVVGAAVWWIALSNMGWVNASAAAESADAKVKAAVVAYATPACVARFQRQPDAAAARETLSTTDMWQRSEVITEGGWVTAPKQEMDYYIARDVAEKCAEQILAVTPPAVQKTSAVQ